MTPARPLRRRLSEADALALADARPARIRDLVKQAGRIRDAAWGRTLTYCPKVFLPITNLCRNRCEYCAFRRSAGDAGEWTMTPDEIETALGRARDQGCYEALICLGDTPETAFPSYRRTLAVLGHERTVDYVEWACERALARGLLPHTNAGVLGSDDMRRLKESNASLGLMLENVSARLCEKGMPHHRAPDKRPEVRVQMLADAGRLQIPFTTGILLGIGETNEERVRTLLAIRDAHERHGHVQEVIIQNFTPHENTSMRHAREPTDDDMAHAVALARIMLPDDVSVQAPPNLNAARTALLVSAGINDFGGISPLTPDYINPDRPWPHIERLRKTLAESGFELAPRLPIYDTYIDRPGFVAPRVREAIAGVTARVREAS